jgi:hypothetical protein
MITKKKFIIFLPMIAAYATTVLKIVKRPLLPWEARLFKLIVQVRVPKDNKSLLEF